MGHFFMTHRGTSWVHVLLGWHLSSDDPTSSKQGSQVMRVRVPQVVVELEMEPLVGGVRAGHSFSKEEERI